VRYAIGASGVVLADIDMFADEITSGQLVMPYDRVSADGFGYYLKTHAEDLGDPAIYLLRDWIIRHFWRGVAQAIARRPHGSGNAGLTLRFRGKQEDGAGLTIFVTLTKPFHVRIGDALAHCGIALGIADPFGPISLFGRNSKVGRLAGIAL